VSERHDAAETAPWRHEQATNTTTENGDVRRCVVQEKRCAGATIFLQASSVITLCFKRAVLKRAA